MKTLCFDLDGVICTATDGSYDLARPYPEAIEAINALYDEGHKVIIFTARFMGRTQHNVIEAHKLGYDFTIRQLAGWGVKYHELHLGKPVYDLIVDDRGVFYRPDWGAIVAAARNGPPAGRNRCTPSS